MSTLELKGSLFDMLWGIEDEETLLRIKEVISELVISHYKEKGDWWDELSAEQQARLRKAIEETERGENLIPHTQVMAKINEKFKTFPE